MNYGRLLGVTTFVMRQSIEQPKNCDRLYIASKKNIFRDISQRFKTKILDLADVKERLEKTKRKVDRLAKKLHKPKADEEFSRTPRGKSIADIITEKNKIAEEQAREQELWEFEQKLKKRRSPNYIQMLTSPAEYEKRKSLRERMEEVEEEFVKTMALGKKMRIFLNWKEHEILN